MLLASEDDVTNQSVHRWAVNDSDPETIIVKIQHFSKTFNEKSETTFDLNKVKMTKTSHIEGQEDINDHFEPWGSRENWSLGQTRF